MVVMFVDCCVGVYGTFRTIPFCSRPNPYSRIPVKLIQILVGMAPVKSPKKIFAQTPFDFSRCPKIDPNFYKTKIIGSAPLGASM